ncbi:uncharacterized protein K452DRAFT_316774 [Aplosporella prunicola CBS 121167]|uniref:PNPLA domain-containing protein n=1 Tax=Aplosporella prunicola CBS 121167 TaxID=1176127 RepID=A0A6A6BKT6_9PEZI|nr:uncharacterized protein K452DRAFT_316774 [Aplosporella prunicola CBS 121167]KAF2143993.1 hypothetical protein K452DRAFT_316774 [Aplosporella prunicola CBS 121167]
MLASSTRAADGVEDDGVLPACTRVHVSDSNERSPWSRKMILAFDGGGIKGYSSLLIMKRLMVLIERLERGLVSPLDPEQTPFPRHDSSEAYAWNTSAAVRSKEPLPEGLWPADDLAEDVERTFAYACTRFKPHHYFDYMAGTSTGGLSAIMLGRMELNVEDALAHYQTVGDQVFGKPRFFPSHVRGSNVMQSKYAARQMEQALQEVTEQALKEELKQWKTTAHDVPFESDANRCRTIVVALGAKATNRVSWQPYLFRSYNHPHPSPLAHQEHNKSHKNPGQAHRHPIWCVARATSAAPTFFEPQRAGDFIFKDGGLGQNNPSHLAWDEVVQLHEQTPALLLSIGTGKAAEPAPGAAKAWLPRFLERLGDNLHLIELLQKIATSTETTHETVRDILEGKAAYFRLNVTHGVGDMALDAWAPKQGGSSTRAAILAHTKVYLRRADVDASLRRCARTLVAARRQRARTLRWERFAARVAYYCPEIPACSKQGRMFSSRDALRRHALEAHSFVRETRVRNDARVRLACVLDECCSEGVHVFAELGEYQKHLAQRHGISEVRFADRAELEGWLDRGRWPLREAFLRRETELLQAREAALAGLAASKAGTAGKELELRDESVSAKLSVLDGVVGTAEDATAGANVSSSTWRRKLSQKTKTKTTRRRKNSSPHRDREREELSDDKVGGRPVEAEGEEGEGKGEGGEDEGAPLKPQVPRARKTC